MYPEKSINLYQVTYKVIFTSEKEVYIQGEFCLSEDETPGLSRCSALQCSIGMLMFHH